MGAAVPPNPAPTPFPYPRLWTKGVLVSKPNNPRNVPTGGRMTYAALEPVTAQQLKFIRQLRRIAHNPPTWEDSCRLILGPDWDGVYETLSVAAASWLIHELQRGLLAVSERREDLELPVGP